MSENPQQPEGGAAPELTEEEMAYVLSLFDMARAGDTENLLPALRAGVPVNLTNGKGDTLLILAAYHRHEDTVAALLEAGADPDRVNDNGQTALLSAVFRGEEGIVRRLLEAGASQTAGAHSAADFAKVFERTELLPVLEEYAGR
ncbi:ankyrin repeat domain-containing protein [Kocuria rosea]|jgi:ankyrin repeat protein|uniref:ankyrin repeat domain-containing protein n=1 Tax=Kocuria rosea TaxID=1275 RepID=UPI00203A4A16|nr:ankyrin repeat domain-containing protein [Kocuria rosea]MCM3688845.1 ankyrin repeat domain-containing protein [Kocuria rosea]HST71003.1 ankyrin repeat domain-containing protein [Kocuria rosea]